MNDRDEKAARGDLNPDLNTVLQHALSDKKEPGLGGSEPPTETHVPEATLVPPEPSRSGKPYTPSSWWRGPSRESAWTPREESCVVLGPAGAGKTCVLAALESACYASPSDDSLQLSLRHGFTLDRQSLLSRDAVEWIANGVHPPQTQSCLDFKLEVAMQLQHSWRRTSQRVITIHGTDSPGTILFPKQDGRDPDPIDARTRRRLLEQMKVATSFILVIDSSASSTDLLERHLQPIMDGITMSSSHVELPGQPGARLWDWLLKRSRVHRRVSFATSRFLLLLTKVDKHALAWSRQLKENGVQASPLAVATALDPVALARELIGERNLRRLWGGMGRRARFAVGVSSVTGFLRDEEHETFAEWSVGRDAQERLGAWNSFGVYEALRFITTGRCGGPVKRVHAEADIVQERALPLHSFPFAR